jgi:type 1 fimbria pilin
MRKVIAATAAAAVMALAPASAFAGKDTAPGQVIKTTCEANYGQIIQTVGFPEGQNQGQHAKAAGLNPGAKSFSSAVSLGIHCPSNG